MARPQKVTDKQLIKGAKEYLDWCKEKDTFPIIKEFALRMGISYNRLVERCQESEELSNAIKAIGDTKQIVLERGAMTGKYHPSMAIFSLKQMGWRDKPDADEIGNKDTEESGVIQIPMVDSTE